MATTSTTAKDASTSSSSSSLTSALSSKILTSQASLSSLVTPAADRTRTVALYRRALEGIHRVKVMLKDSPLTVLGINTKQTAKISDIVEQAKILCEDYIYHRLEATLSSREEGNSSGAAGGGGGSGWGVATTPPPPAVTEVSREIQLIGHKLESTYPTLYQNVAKQACIPLRSEMLIRKSLTSLGDHMFRHNVVTWARIVAYFSICAGLAADCVQSDRVEVIQCIVNVFADVIERNAAAWISAQGGWVEIMKAFRPNEETRRLWFLTSFGSLIGFVFTWLTTNQI